MQCERCSFENLPGLDRCARCQAVLVVREPVDVIPPRAGRTKIVRPILYWLVARLAPGINTQRWEHAFRGAVLGLGGFLAAVVSVVPGLGHLLLRSLHKIYIFLIAWAGLLGIGLLFYATGFGGICIGLAVAVHARSVVDALLGKKKPAQVVQRVVLVMATFVALFLGVYWNVRRFAGRYVQGVFTLSPYEPDRIRVGDYVLAYVRAYRERDPARGELVLYETPAGGVGEVRLVAGRAVGYVVGLPGESVTVRDDRFYVDGEALSGVRYEVPSWLRGGRLESHLSPNEYFALPSDVAFLYRGRRASPPPELISLLCKPTRSAIVGRVFMVYNPIWRRHFLRRD